MPAATSQRTAILRGFPAVSAMGCDHLDAIALGQIAVQVVIADLVESIVELGQRLGIELLADSISHSSKGRHGRPKPTSRSPSPRKLCLR